jgi:hypothetical protein
MKTNTNWKSNTSVRTFANACKASCQKLIDQFTVAKQKILNEFRQTVGANEHLLQLALNEAEALAWQTEVPYLVFPDLAVEKVQAVTAWTARQNLMREGSSHSGFAA